MLRALLVLIALAMPASADPDRLSVLLGSAHPGGQSFDGRNPGLFLTWEDRAGLDWSLGLYRNSFGRASVASTAALPMLTWQGGEAALLLGAAIYPGDGGRFAFRAGDLVLLGGLQIRHGAAFVQIMPGEGMAVIAAGITIPLQ